MSVAVPAFNRRIVVGRRYTRFVESMRVVLPLTALALTAVLVLWPQLSGFESSYIVPLSGTPDIASDGSMRLDEPRYIGRTSANEPFEVTADTARINPRDPDRVSLDAMVADMQTNSGDALRLTAPSGLFDRGADTLDLAGGIVLTSREGYRLTTERAHVDVGAGTVRTRTPVSGASRDGTIEARRMTAHQGGDVLIFKGDVRVVYGAGGTARQNGAGERP